MRTILAAHPESGSRPNRAFRMPRLDSYGLSPYQITKKGKP